MPEEMTLEQEIDRIFATLGNAEIVTGAGARPIVAAWTPEPEDRCPKGPTATPTTGIRTSAVLANRRRPGPACRPGSLQETRTERTGASSPATRDHVAPASAEPNTSPEVAPK